MEVKKLREFTGHTAAIYSLSKSGRAGHFISCGSEGIVAEWNIESGEGIAMAKAPSAVFSICLVEERQLLLLGLQTGDLIFVDIHTGQPIKRVQLHSTSIFDLLLLPDRQHVLASGEDGAISLWNLDRLDHLHYQKIAAKSVRTLCLDATGRRIFAGASDNRIREFDLGLNLKADWEAHARSIFRLLPGLLPNELISTGRDAHIRKWELGVDGAHEKMAIPAHNYAVNDLIYDNDHRWLMSGSMDKSFKIWNPETLELLKVVNFEKNQCHWNGVNRLLWLDGNLLTCSDDRKIMQWRFDS